MRKPVDITVPEQTHRHSQLLQSLLSSDGHLCRGCGDLPLEAPMIYSAVDTSDIHAAVLHIQRIYPEAPLLLAGFSLGAMLVTKYLADIESGSLQPAGLSPYVYSSGSIMDTNDYDCFYCMCICCCGHFHQQCMKIGTKCCLIPARAQLVLLCSSTGAGTKPVAAVASSSPFDIGAAWKRSALASWLDSAYWIQCAVVFRFAA